MDGDCISGNRLTGSASRSDHGGCVRVTRNELVASEEMAGGRRREGFSQHSAATLIGYVPAGRPGRPNPFGLFGLHVVALVQHCARTFQHRFRSLIGTIHGAGFDETTLTDHHISSVHIEIKQIPNRRLPMVHVSPSLHHEGSPGDWWIV